jgi:hypothetical protein
VAFSTINRLQFMSEFQTPLIFDDSFDSSHYPEEGHFGGQFTDSILAHSGAFMSMSAYEKPSLASLQEFHANGALYDAASFAGYAQPPYTTHYAHTTAMNPAAQPDFQYVTSPEVNGLYNFEGPRAAMLDQRARPIPQITSFTREGCHGNNFTVYIQTPHDLLSPPNLRFSLQFNSARVATTIQAVHNTGSELTQYAISGIIPAFTDTKCYAFSVLVHLIMDVPNEPSITPLRMEVGNFDYTHAVQASSQKKRKASDSPEYDVQPPSKKFASRDHSLDSYDQASPYSSFLTTPTNGTTYSIGNQASASPRRNGHQYSTSNASQISLAAPSPHTPAWSPSFSTIKSEHSPRPPMTPVQRPASTPSMLKASVTNPKLVRTSTIQTSPVGLSAVARPDIVTQTFNPYAMYPLKATLKLNGDLDAMAKDWTPEEFDARRRLVQFTRSQVQSTINADFKAIAPEDRPPSSITISCIWWKERNECFVTSVDTIYLLEALVGVRFTVEEKNRIRRNLEGFRPLTVSKSKLDSEDFFKTIMGFPNPKPRNIEKDVKVFPWKILAHALKKIISKYSASYSSTASAILTPASSAYASTESSAECHCAPSPHAELADYPVSNQVAYVQTMPQGRMSAPVTGAMMPDLRVQVPLMAPNYNMPVSYGYQQMSQMSQSYPSQSMSAPIGPMSQSWEYASFVNESPASMAQYHGPPSHHSSRSIETAEFVTPPEYSLSGN